MGGGVEIFVMRELFVTEGRHFEIETIKIYTQTYVRITFLIFILLGHILLHFNPGTPGIIYDKIRDKFLEHI